MLAARELPDFHTTEQRDRYIRDHADYFAVSYRTRNLRIRTEHAALEEARVVASFIARAVQKPLMIYAVLGCYDALVETVQST